jgi:hypothetical protein
VPAQRFPAEVLAALRKDKIIGLRAGREPHRFIGLWVVVVENRAFVRSWAVSDRSWRHAFLKDPHGVIQAAGREIVVRAVRTRSERLKDLVSRAYREKYHTPGSIQFVRDMARPKSRATTTELVPAEK